MAYGQILGQTQDTSQFITKNEVNQEIINNTVNKKLLAKQHLLIEKPEQNTYVLPNLSFNMATEDYLKLKGIYFGFENVIVNNTTSSPSTRVSCSIRFNWGGNGTVALNQQIYEPYTLFNQNLNNIVLNNWYTSPLIAFNESSIIGDTSSIVLRKSFSSFIFRKVNAVTPEFSGQMTNEFNDFTLLSGNNVYGLFFYINRTDLGVFNLSIETDYCLYGLFF